MLRAFEHFTAHDDRPRHMPQRRSLTERAISGCRAWLFSTTNVTDGDKVSIGGNGGLTWDGPLSCEWWWLDARPGCDIGHALQMPGAVQGTDPLRLGVQTMSCMSGGSPLHFFWACLVSLLLLCSLGGYWMD